MGANAPLWAVAIGSALPLVAVVVMTALARWASRDGREYEAEIKGPFSIAIRIRLGAPSHEGGQRALRYRPPEPARGSPAVTPGVWRRLRGKGRKALGR
jgi:hypothetical protein